MKEIKPWIDVVRLHPDVESESTALSTYALDLGALVEMDPNLPSIYRDPYSFFRATHITTDIKNLIQEVYDRLSGKEGNRVLQLRSPFGGGKSHTLATLYYAVKNRKEMEMVIPETKDLPQLKDVRVAVFDGEKFDAVSGTKLNGQSIRTLWGYLAYQLSSYELIKEQDQKRIAPGGKLIKKILSDKPTLIILDEVSRYLERAMAEKVGESTLYRQTMEFLQTLTTEVAGSKYACMVYSLQASAREFYGNTEILATLDHLASRVDAKREPIRGDEIFFVLRKRLLAEPPDEAIANKVADEYTDSLRRNIFSYVSSDEERREIEERLIKYRQRFVIAYPFHPALIDLMRERWASIPDFQRTRGVLRFLAVVLRTLKKRNVRDYLIAPTDIPLDDPEVKNAFFTEVGQRETFQAVLEADFIGPNATVKRIDKTIFKDAKEPATKIATAILMFSFGGLPKAEGEETLPGVTENDLLFSVISPYLDSTTTKAVLKELVAKCLYIHYDGTRYAFKTTPNVNKLLEDEVEAIRDEDINSTIKSMLEEELGGKSAIIWPRQSKDIPDRVPRFQIAYLPLEFVYKSEKEKEKIGLEYLTQYGDKPRIYKNALALAIPDKNQIEPLRRAVKYLIAIDHIKEKKKTLNLTEEQLEQLKEREKTEQAGRDSSFRNLYNSLWLLKMEEGRFTIETVEVGGRALKETNIHERLMELLMRMPPPKVFDSLTPRKFLELAKIEKGMETKDIIDNFFSSLDFPRVVDENVIRAAISRCIKEGLLGITSKDKVQIVEDKPFVPEKQITIKKDIPLEEIDTFSTYLINPDIIQIKEGQRVIAQPKEETEKLEISRPEISRKERITQIKYLLKNVNRQQLYKCFEAIGNLAKECGSIFIIIEAKSEEGIDKNWLRNAVEEPIEETGVEIEKEEK